MHKVTKQTLFTENNLLYPVSLFLSAILLLLTLSGCSGIPISYYDATTYTQLTSLKAETTLLVESFDTKPVSKNETSIEQVTLSLRKAYEYEYGKGNPNGDTSKQFEKIMTLFSDDVKDYREDGPVGFDEIRNNC